MTVTAAGFQQSTVSAINVTGGNVFTVPVALAVGQQATSVEAAAAAVTVDTTTSTQSDTIPTTALQYVRAAAHRVQRPGVGKGPT